VKSVFFIDQYLSFENNHYFFAIKILFIMSHIHGIQHIGVAVSDMNRTLPLYRKWFGMNIPFFDSVQSAPLMQTFTRQQIITKRASMVMNLNGGSALEVIEPTSFSPSPLPLDFELGDIGIFAVHMRMQNPQEAHSALNKYQVSSCMEKDPMNCHRFLLQDPDRLYFIAIEDTQIFSKSSAVLGGVNGLSIGVSDMSASISFYALLGFTEVLFRGKGVYPDLFDFPGGNQEVERVILSTKQGAKGPFGAVIGYSKIELICTLNRKGKRIFKGRIWGDTGFVHLGLDIVDMKGLQKKLSSHQIEIECDSETALSMGKTQVHCAYICDPDGILIELIEVYKIPLIEKWGVFLNVHGKRAGQNLPSWLIRLLRFSKIS
jgi:catechol 2,3-dioxygenase-like lactoylglutathione lyase family enzyme